MVPKVERIIDHCPPGCPKNNSHESCACAPSSRIIVKVIIAATWSGIKRYSAWFTPRTEKEKAKKKRRLPRTSNAQLFDERGQNPIKTRIPNNIWVPMAEAAHAVIESRKTGISAPQK